jgi:competence ComEA-like helix-hairpin-helix protein
MPEAEAAAPGGDDALVDLRTAEMDDLRRLPGVGPVLAQRILDYRSSAGGFTKPEDLLSVPGIGLSVYQNLAGHITVTEAEASPPPPEPEPAPVAEMETQIVSPSEPEPPPAPTPAPEPPPATPAASEPPPAAPPVPEPTPPPPQRPAQPQPTPAAPRTYAVPLKPQRDLLGLFLSSLAGALMGALLTLVTLALINRGTLNLNEKADLEVLSGRVNALSTDVSGVRNQADDLASRLDALSGLPDRVGAVEEQAAKTAAGLRDTSEQVTALDRRTTELAGQVETILGAVGRFNRFLDGLRDLLLNTDIAPTALPTNEPAPSATVAPTNTVAPTSTPAPTQTRAPTRTALPSTTPAG